MTASVFVFAQVAEESLLPEIEARLALIEAFYGPLGPLRTEAVWVPDARVLAVQVEIGESDGDTAGRQGPHPHDPPHRAARVWTWGESLPAELADAHALLDAEPRTLDSIAGVTAAFAFDPDGGRARVVTGPAGPAVLFAAAGDGVATWSTHAVAAALVARGEARIDALSVPELIAFDFVGGERTLVEGVRCPPPASDVHMDAAGAREGVWKRSGERWSLDPEDLAYDRAESRLIATLAARLRGRDAAVALTAGLDSRVVAVALTEAGVAFDSFTWGSEDWPDSVGAATVAAALDVRHTLFEHQALEPDEVLPEHDRAVRWSDGLFALAPAAREWPDADVIVGGMGGETGRAFYYDAWSSWLWPSPDHAVLADRLAARAHLPTASDDAIASADRAVHAWLEEAHTASAAGGPGADPAERARHPEGWRLLDVVYSDQRVRRWGRGQLPPTSAVFVPAFTPGDVQRALASQPLAARLISEFHRDFVERHNPDLAFAPNPPQSMPPSPLRAIHRRRHRRQRAANLGRRPAEAGDSYVAHVWAERAAARDWVVEHALPHALTGGLMGGDWIDWTRTGFPQGAWRAGEQARLAAAVVALDDALRSLRRPSGP